MTRGKVIQLGLAVLALGGFGYGAFRLLGFDWASSGIAAQSILVIVVLGWTGSYLFRVVSGKMTFMEQRKRYRQAYDELTTSQLQERFDSMSEAEQRNLLAELDREKK